MAMHTHTHIIIKYYKTFYFPHWSLQRGSHNWLLPWLQGSEDEGRPGIPWPGVGQPGRSEVKGSEGGAA